jgi:hypothetical protein
MTIKLGDLKLLPLLAATRWMIRKAAKRSVRIRTLLHEEPFTFQIVTRSGVGGHFILEDGHLHLHWGRHQRPDFSQVWRSGADAVRLLTSTDETSMLRGYEEGRYTMQGRFTIALWFNEVMKLARNSEAEPGR